MTYFTQDNTYGYSDERLDYHNDNFVEWAKGRFDLENENELKSAYDKYHNEVMIHG